MPFTLIPTKEADDALQSLQADPAAKATYKAVAKALAYLEQNPRHPSLQTHEYHSMKGMNGEKVWEAYAQNKTPGAWRIFFHYGPGSNTITVIAITPHP